MERSKRQVQPTLEGLEGRALMNATRITPSAISPATQAGSNRVLSYVTNQGSRVTVTLDGPGSLAGSAVRADGTLDLVYSGTNTASRIIGRVKGGSGTANLGSIRNANVPIASTTGVGAEVINIVRLPDFDLVSGGNINLLGGVNELTLNSAAPNSQIRLRDTPLNTTVASLPTNNIASLAAERYQAQLNPTTTAFGGGNVNATTGAIDFIDTTGNGQNAQGTPGLSQSQVSNGRNNSYAFQPNGALRLTAAGGTFVPGTNLLEPRDVSKPGPAPAPPGVVISINQINGSASAARVLDDFQITNNELAGVALIDVQGNVQSFRSQSVNGLVLNDAGNLNLIRIKRLANSSIVGLPISHLTVGNPVNTSIVSSARLIQGRGGVTVNKAIVPSGPLTLP